ncbi:MAG: DNA polymerase III subunit beta [Deltaproteobacteria bacterium]
MEFVVSKREFVKGLARVQNVADKRAAMPILTNVLVQADATGLHLAATDLMLSVSSTVAADVRKAGSVALPAKSVFEMVKALPEGEISVVVGPNFSARVTGGRRRFEIVGMPGDDFPALPSPGSAEMRDLPIDAVADLIAMTSFSMSSDETRPHLAGALLENDGMVLRMVTTDGHRLSKGEKRVSTAAKSPMSLLVPAKGIHELKRLLDEAKGEKKPEDGSPLTVAVGQSGSNVFLRREGTQMAVKLVEAAFPAYQQVIPQSNDRSARVSRSGLLEALRAVSLVSADRTSGVKLQFTANKLIISSENPDVGAGSDEIESDLTGEPLTIGFNSRYLIDVLNALSSDEVALDMSGELDPGVVRPAGSDEFVGVIMPMRI